MANLFGDEQLDCFAIGGKPLLSRKLFRPPHQVLALRTLAQLKLLDRRSDSRQFRFVELGAPLPGYGQQ